VSGLDLRDAVIAGVGEADPVRRSGRTAEQLALQAIAAAIADAGLSPGDIDCIVTEGSLCPAMTPTDRIAPAAGIVNLRRVAQSSPIGAGILAALGMACEMVASGAASHVLTYFAVDWGTFPAGPVEYHTKMQAKAIVEEPVGFAGPPLYFAVAAQRYKQVYGLSDEALHAMLADIVIATRANASLHPAAQARQTLDAVSYQANPMIAEPLRAADCSLLSDGAGAIVVSRRSLWRAQRPDVGLKSWSYAVDPIPDVDFYTQSPWLPQLPATSRASAAALAAAGLTPAEIDMFQIYDCFSIAIALQLEAIGRAAPGCTKDLVAGGATRHDGALPVNTHGGLLSHGYVLGIGHAVEAIRQLRGEAGARQVAGAKNAFVGAGPGRQYTSLILERRDG